MELIQTSGGHCFNIKYAPDKKIKTTVSPKLIALTPRGFDVKPRVVVKTGEKIKRGQEVFHDKKDSRVKFVSPFGGEIESIIYGKRRSLEAVVISVAHVESEEKIAFATSSDLNREQIIGILLNAGLWPQFKTFPGRGIPSIPENLKEDFIDSCYVSLFNTEPHMPDIGLTLSGNEEYFISGINVLKNITSKIFIFLDSSDSFLKILEKLPFVENKVIKNKYPNDNFGVQRFYVKPEPFNRKSVGISVEAVINIGHLFVNKILRSEKLYCVAGNGANDCFHARGSVGLNVSDLTSDSIRESGDLRFLAGGLITGTKISKSDYLNLNDCAVQVLIEDRERTPFVFFRLGLDRLTLSRAWMSSFVSTQSYAPSTSNNGEERACIQCGYCVDVCPVKLFPCLIMKASLESDIEKMEFLGIHDCVDCGLCSFVCPAKIELGKDIENGKFLIAKEG